MQEWHVRIGDGFHSIVSSVYYKLDVSSCKSINSLQTVSRWLAAVNAMTFTSNAETGVGAPGAPIAPSSYCSSSVLIVSVRVLSISRGGMYECECLRKSVG